MNETMSETIALCHQDDIPESESRGFELRNKYLFVVRKDGQLYVYYNYCPHLGTPLEWQEDQFLDAEAALIQCSTHGALFLIEDGECVAGPCKGKRLQAIPFEIEDGRVTVQARAIDRLGRLP